MDADGVLDHLVGEIGCQPGLATQRRQIAVRQTRPLADDAGAFGDELFVETGQARGAFHTLPIKSPPERGRELARNVAQGRSQNLSESCQKVAETSISYHFDPNR